MSLNRTLDRLFEEIRREAKRNPDFADRLDAVLRLHESRRDVPDATLEEAARPPTSEEAPEAAAKPKRRRAVPPAEAEPATKPQAKAAAVQEPPALNPAGLYKKSGAEALSKALASRDLGALRALVSEHNLDPSGVTPSLTRDELASHILAQAKRRAERDERMFDY